MAFSEAQPIGAIWVGLPAPTCFEKSPKKRIPETMPACLKKAKKRIPGAMPACFEKRPKKRIPETMPACFEKKPQKEDS